MQDSLPLRWIAVENMTELVGDASECCRVDHDHMDGVRALGGGEGRIPWQAGRLFGA